MLVGFLEPTAGTAYIEGLDIMQDLDTIYTLVGVCPQHDTVWARLTGREHLEFYGRLKNLPPSRLISDVDDALRAVNLSAAADRLVGTYSGGMRRRLSVAMSIIGSPRWEVEGAAVPGLRGPFTGSLLAPTQPRHLLLVFFPGWCSWTSRPRGWTLPRGATCGTW